MKSLMLSCFFLLFCVVPLWAQMNPLLENSLKYQSIKVTGMVSVDLLVVEGDRKVALIGIEGPLRPAFKSVVRDEHGFIVHEREDATTPFEVEAMRFVYDLVKDQLVRLEFDAERRSDNGAMWAYVYLPDGRMLNEVILAQGYARLKLRMPNFKYAERFRSAYQESRRNMRGLQGQW
jgi:endonuclease YncB( thermonuclease family)